VSLESQLMTQTRLQLQQSSTVSVMLFILLTSSILYSQYSTLAAPCWPLVATRSQSAAAALSHRPVINCHIHWHASGTWRRQAHRTAHPRCVTVNTYSGGCRSLDGALARLVVLCFNSLSVVLINISTQESSDPISRRAKIAKRVLGIHLSVGALIPKHLLFQPS